MLEVVAPLGFLDERADAHSLPRLIFDEPLQTMCGLCMLLIENKNHYNLLICNFLIDYSIFAF